MYAGELLTELQRQGFTLTPLPGGKLEVKPASRLPQELRAELKQRKAEVLALLQQQEPPAPLDYRQLYHQAADVVSGDCWSIDPVWLINHHPELWKWICSLDDQLTAMERTSASRLEYHSALARLVRYIQNARTLYEREHKQSSERVVQ